MNTRTDITTALLATVFGGALLAANHVGAQLDPRTVRELAVISRVLEKRLGETRRSFTASVLPSASDQESSEGTS